ncbi:hypothetical protein Rxycam_01398 [Rubrobacter xylanophilus DSM 9941]|nr:hypothetical protein Rxycam_01398 [Rubrobacter xylanophilus DSM 9941]
MTSEGPHPAASRDPVRPRVLTRPLVLVFASSFGFSTSFYLLLSVVPIYAASVGAGEAGAGLATGSLMLSTVAAELLTPLLLSRFGYRMVFAAGLALLGAPAFVLGFAPTVAGILAVCLARGFGLGIVLVVGGALVAELVPPERRGEGLGLYGVAVGVPFVVALPLVHPQRGLCVMGYSSFHETSNICPGIVRRGAQETPGGAARRRRFRTSPVPDPSGECPREVSSEDRPRPRVRFANGEERHPSLQRARPRRPHAWLLSPQARVRRLRREERRGFAGDAPPLAEGVRTREQPVDSGDGRRRRLRGGAHRGASLRGDHPGHLVAPSLGEVDAG